MSDNAQKFGHLADRGRATSRECPNIWTFGIQGASNQKMSGNGQIFGHLADRGQAISKCQRRSKYLDIWRTGAKLPVM